MNVCVCIRERGRECIESLWRDRERESESVCIKSVWEGVYV